MKCLYSILIQSVSTSSIAAAAAAAKSAAAAEAEWQSAVSSFCMFLAAKLKNKTFWMHFRSCGGF